MGDTNPGHRDPAGLHHEVFGGEDPRLAPPEHTITGEGIRAVADLLRADMAMQRQRTGRPPARTERVDAATAWQLVSERRSTPELLGWENACVLADAAGAPHHHSDGLHCNLAPADPDEIVCLTAEWVEPATNPEGHEND